MVEVVGDWLGSAIGTITGVGVGVGVMGFADGVVTEF